MTKIYEVIADGKKIGITVANNEREALAGSLSGTSRKTDSKCGVECDYTCIEVKLLVTGDDLAEAKQVIKDVLEKVVLESSLLLPQSPT